MVNSKKKGNIWENKLANWLVDNGIKAWKDGMSGGGNREKGDVGNNIDMTIESKAAKKIELLVWWKQVVRSASKHNNTPVLFIHQDGMPDKEWLVVMHNEDWINLAKAVDFVDTTYEDPTRKYEVRNAIEALKKVLKHYEN